MNRNLKEQLKLAFEAPKPKRKQQFLDQIEKYNQKERTNLSFRRIFGQKWVWATSFSIMLLLVSMFGKQISTIEVDSKLTHCPCHIWTSIEEKDITQTQRYSYSRCITCGEVRSKVEIIAYQEKKFCVAEEVLQPNIEIKLR